MKRKMLSLLALFMMAVLFVMPGCDGSDSEGDLGVYCTMISEDDSTNELAYTQGIELKLEVEGEVEAEVEAELIGGALFPSIMTNGSPIIFASLEQSTAIINSEDWGNPAVDKSSLVITLDAPSDESDPTYGAVTKIEWYVGDTKATTKLIFEGSNIDVEYVLESPYEDSEAGDIVSGTFDGSIILDDDDDDDDDDDVISIVNGKFKVKIIEDLLV